MIEDLKGIYETVNFLKIQILDCMTIRKWKIILRTGILQLKSLCLWKIIIP